MIKEIINKWEENKSRLEEYFRTTKQEDYCEYSLIVEKIFELVINDEEDCYLTSQMTIIDDGDFQGTKIFIVPKDTCQPNIEDYIVTSTYYGSCSGCDTLQGIRSYDDDLPSEEQVKEYMTLALHLVQKMKYLG